MILKENGLSIKDAATIIGKSEGYVRKLIRPGGNFDIEPVMCALNSMNDISIEWLLTGQGSMSKSDVDNNKSAIHNEAVLINPEYVIYAPLVSQYVYAGCLSGYADHESIEMRSSVPFLVDREECGNYIAFDVNITGRK